MIIFQNAVQPASYFSGKAAVCLTEVHMGNTDNQEYTKEIKWDLKPTVCSKCGGELSYKSLGEYVCESCGNIERDDFGKVRSYIDENGPTPAVIISEQTGVAIDKINEFLRQGRVEIPEGSDIYIKCEKCGTDIRFGRFCPACAAKLSKQLKGVFEVGEVPKKKSAVEGKMRFIGKNNPKKY